MEMNVLMKAWENRTKIWEGLRNKTFKQDHIEALSEGRMEICRSNACGYYDKLGESEKAAFKGQESCGACGCRLDWKTRSASSSCGLIDVNKEPLWHSVVNEQEEGMIKAQINSKNQLEDAGINSN